MLEPADIDKLWNYDEPAASEQRFRDQLPAVEPGGVTHIALLTQVARAQGLQRQFEAAHATLDEAQQRLTDGMTVARLRYLLERGRVYNSARQAEQAAPLFRAAWELATTSAQDFYAVDAAHMLGICEPPAQQIEWNERALALAEISGDPRARGWAGSLYNNLGWTYHDQGDFARALDLFERGAAFRQEQGQTPQWRMARWCVARCLRSLGRTAEALEQQQRLHEEHGRAGTRDGFVAEELGECLLALGRGDEARPYFRQAYIELAQDPWLQEGEPARLERLKALGEGAAG
ncbi:MAG: tetratricopeptide repeat protein [Anaerolineales bacterium]|nr:tetratricopeptide repeat protein [Anaerolineales bacterium]